MAVRKIPDRFLVAFSFAGEERDLVRSIAEEVERQLGPSTVFLDEWFTYYIAGDDSDLRLQTIYGERCELVVVGVSEAYGTKPWTLIEHAAVRAKSMKLRVSKMEKDKHRILPIRVGEGDVEGVLFNSIVPEARGKSIAETAALIVNKLRLVVPDPNIENLNIHVAWPKEPAPFTNGLADLRDREWPAILQLLSGESTKRILMFRGPSGHSKSALLGAAEKYAKMLEVPTVYVDFKDTMLLNENNILREIQLGFRRILPSFASESKPDRWKLRIALASLQDAALILLDTYEKAAETKELVDWIETRLLADVEDCLPLRIIIGGQKVPAFENGRWRDHAEIVELAGIHDKQAWKDWVKEKSPDVDEKSIEAFVKALNGVPSTISSTLTTLVEGLKQSA